MHRPVGRRALVVVCAALALWLPTAGVLSRAAPEGPALGAWSPVEELSPAGVPADSPSVATDKRSRTTTVVWRAKNAGHWRVQESHRPFGGSWSAVSTVSAPGVDAADPQVAVIGPGYGADAYRVVAWLSGPPDAAALQASVQVGDDAWSAPVTLAPALRHPTDFIAYASRHVDYGCDGCGAPDDVNLPMVFWRDFDGRHWRARAVVLEEDGTAVSALTALSRAGGDAKDLNLWGQPQWLSALSWSRWNGSHWRGETVEFEEWLPGGSAAWDLPYFGEDQLETHVGQTAAVWTNEASGVTRLRAVCLRHQGQACASPVTVSSEGADVTSVLALAEVPPGELVVWQEQQPGGPVRLMYSIAEKMGAWSTGAPLSSDGASVGSSAISAPTANSPLLAVWTQTGADPGLLWSTYGPGGWSTPEPFGDQMADSPDLVSDLDAGALGTELGPDALAWTRRVDGHGTVVVRGFDSRPPEVVTVGVTPNVALAGNATLTWLARDDWSTVKSYDVRQHTVFNQDRRGAVSRLLSGTSSTSELLTGLEPGGEYCFAVRARDSLRHLGAWTVDWPRSCVQTPFDDRSLAVVTGGWRRIDGARFYLGSALAAARRGSSLSMAVRQQFSAIKLVASTGPAMGKVRATLGRHSRVVDLATPERGARVLRTLFRDDGSSLVGTLRLEVVSSGRPVRVDGVLLDRE